MVPPCAAPHTRPAEYVKKVVEREGVKTTVKVGISSGRETQVTAGLAAGDKVQVTRSPRDRQRPPHPTGDRPAQEPARRRHGTGTGGFGGGAGGAESVDGGFGGGTVAPLRGRHTASTAPVIDLDGVRKIYRTGAVEVEALEGVTPVDPTG